MHTDKAFLNSSASVLQCRLSLDQAQTRAFHGLNFLGGLLHGLVRAAWWAELGGHAGGHEAGLYRVIAPPVTLGSWLDPNGGLQFQVLLAHALTDRRQVLERALHGIRKVTDGAEHYVVKDVQTQWLALDWPTPMARSNETEAVTLSFQWLTPLHMVSRRQLAAGFGDQPPSLLRISRSLARRARAFAPEWADRLGVGGPDWMEVEESWRDAERLQQATKTFVWRYGSRTKQIPVQRHGLVGDQSFVAKNNAALEALLLAGPWLGVGEGASFGCGGYALTITECFEEKTK